MLCDLSWLRRNGDESCGGSGVGGACVELTTASPGVGGELESESSSSAIFFGAFQWQSGCNRPAGRPRAYAPFGAADCLHMRSTANR